MKKIFLLILKQIHEDLYFFHKDFRYEKQFKRPPTTHRDSKAENTLF